MIFSNDIMAFAPSHSFMFQTQEDQDHLPAFSNTLLACFPQQYYHGGTPHLMKRSMSFSGIDNKCHEEVHGEDEQLSDDGIQIGEKKKRLSLEQAKALENSFELGKKLEPEKKVQLANALGLQPRQIAIWFQNRRARWKTKQLERDYDILKKQFESLKADKDALQAHNMTLNAELLVLKSKDTNEAGLKSMKKETVLSRSLGSENICDINLDNSTPIMNSLISSQLSSKYLFPSSLTRPTSMPQLLQGSSRSDHLQHVKTGHKTRDESLSNMFNSIEDQHGFWPWPEQQHFH